MRQGAPRVRRCRRGHAGSLLAPRLTPPITTSQSHSHTVLQNIGSGLARGRCRRGHAARASPRSPLPPP
eukprot:4058376-Prymnesium_polylepis.2